MSEAEFKVDALHGPVEKGLPRPGYVHPLPPRGTNRRLPSHDPPGSRACGTGLSLGPLAPPNASSECRRRFGEDRERKRSEVVSQPFGGPGKGEYKIGQGLVRQVSATAIFEFEPAYQISHQTS